MAPLIRRADGIELPAPCIWAIVTASHVAIAPTADEHPIATAVHSGHLVATPAVEDTVVYLALGVDGDVTFTGKPVQVVATNFGCAEWTIDGVLTDDAGTAPMTLTLGYHGVGRRANRAWAWFTGSGWIDRPANASTHHQRCEVVVDLMFEAPAHDT